jgi:CheY-like chemotaxis protein
MEAAQHIVVVDDHRDIRDLVGQYLTQQGYRVSVAESTAALKRLLDAARRHDVTVVYVRHVFAADLTAPPWTEAKPWGPRWGEATSALLQKRAIGTTARPGAAVSLGVGIMGAILAARRTGLGGLAQ